MPRKQTKKKNSKSSHRNEVQEKAQSPLKFQTWKDMFSEKILAGYALPMARNVEAKLINLRNRLER